MIISKTKKKIFELKNVAALLEKTTLLREKLDTPFQNDKDIASYKTLAFDLYNQLIPNSLQSELKNKKVTIIADHMISFIPFEALITDIDKNTYLIEESEINYALSLSFEKENSKVLRKATNDFLGVAPIVFSNGLTTLKKSEDEITTAMRYYDGDLFVRENATKDNFKQHVDNYKILHLATHADASDKIAPWIAFHHEKMSHLELNTLRSQAELVILSACNSSLGEVRRGEGVLSLARGFFKSGAKSVIPSLWSTNDKATATITSDFYKNLSNGQTKSAALRASKLNYLHNNSDAEASPHYWSSLILIGDSGTLLPKSNHLIVLWICLGIVLLVLFSYTIIRIRKRN
ncbi:CHAT domain-containing protein [Aquimarina sp. M1]